MSLLNKLLSLYSGVTATAYEAPRGHQVLETMRPVGQPGKWASAWVRMGSGAQPVGVCILWGILPRVGGCGI